MNRRRFVQTAAQAAIFGLAGLETVIGKDSVTISILHTTDLHGHILPTFDYDNHPDLGGLARCATQIKRWRQENPHTLLLDIGDVYQGTEESLSSRGGMMINCLNALNYDAWVVGNHEFDWGADVFATNVNHSAMPVLSCNVSSGLAGLHRYLIKEIAGFKIAVIGLTTSGLPYWLPPEFLRDFNVLEPKESLRRTLQEVSTQQPDAILLAGHMGLRERDDFANRVDDLNQEFPRITAFLGGHTHKNYSSLLVNNVLYTQADHFGIYAGKIDLTFDVSSRRLLKRTAVTVLMDRTVACDPLILSLAKNDLKIADEIMATSVGVLEERMDIVREVTQPSDVERLIGSAIIESLLERQVTVDVVVHGPFDTKNSLSPGLKTIRDLWAILPYENQIVTSDLTFQDLLALVQDFSASWGKDQRAVMGIQLVGEKQGKGFLVQNLLTQKGTLLDKNKIYRVALNSYDSQSGGQRFFTVAQLVAHPGNQRRLHSLMTRDALIAFFKPTRKSQANFLTSLMGPPGFEPGTKGL